MSTDQQQYSLDNQAEAIQRYAESHGFTVVQTYTGGGKSGLSIKNRTGLARLLQEVISAEAAFKAVLVYDVSRWGRFRDCDEAAHYEFLCRSAGVPVHYCAEQFPSDGSLSTSILKALKRTMAAEYSRELGVKVYAGKAFQAAHFIFDQLDLYFVGIGIEGVPDKFHNRVYRSRLGHPLQIVVLNSYRYSFHGK